MQSKEQNLDTIKVPKSTKSITLYPKIIPTYVVAFAMHETYDDLMTTQQMICKQSPQGSINSVTPTNSVIFLDSNAIEKFPHIIDMPADNNEIKTLKVAYQYPDDVKALETTIEINNEKVKNIQPEIIFNATRTKRSKEDSKFRKKSCKNKRVAKIRNLNFKCKHCKSIAKQIELHYTKSKRNAVATDIVEKGLCNLSNVMNKSRVLKKVLAVENLLEEQQFLGDFNTKELSSLSSSTIKKGILSHSSDITITREWSSSSSRDYYSSINSSNSVIQVSSENMIPYKTDVINVAVAVAYNKAKANENKLQAKQFIMENDEIYVAKHKLSSTETVILPPVILTSKPQSFEKTPWEMVSLIEDGNSDLTLIDSNKKSSLAMSIDEDTFIIARTSSDFNKSSFHSNMTLTNSETQSDDTINGNAGFTRENEYNNKKLLNTVINIGMFPEPNTSTSKLHKKTVIITKEHTTFAKKDDEVILNEQNELPKNILKKSFDVEKNVVAQKIITLPDEAVIRSKLKQNQQYQRKTETEIQNSPPSTLADIWKRLILILDAGLKRIEETLPSIITKEIKKAIDFDEYKNFVLKVISENKSPSIKVKENTKVNKEVSVNMLKTETDESLQCDLVQNQVIDQLMSKIYQEGPTDELTAKFSNKFITKIFKDYLEVLSPGVGRGLEMKESITVSGIEPELMPDVERFSLLKVLMTVPIKFMKENAFVMTSVPTFLLILLCMYGLIVFIMKPL